MPTFQAELTQVSAQGFWLRLDDEALQLSFQDFPWFTDATIAQMRHVERLSADHLYWPLLDIDLSVASIRNPAAYPLIAQTPAFNASKGLIQSP